MEQAGRRRPTPEQASWLLSFFGVDISKYADEAGTSQPGDAASHGAQTANNEAVEEGSKANVVMPDAKPVPVGGIRHPDGTPVPLPEGTVVPAPAVAQPAAPQPTPAQWLVQNKAAMDALQAGSARVVMPGPAQVAQKNLLMAWNAINNMLQAGNIQAATKLLGGVQPQVAVVIAQPDAVSTPIIPGKHPDQILFGKETPAPSVPGMTDPQDVMQTDVNQGMIGDCYFLAVVGDIAKMKPAIIRNMIKDNGNGTYTVTFYQHKGGVSGFFASLLGGSDFEPVLETVDSNFGSNVANTQQPGDGRVGNQHEIWVAVVEKAFAKLNGGYDKITQGGYPMNAMEAVTGKKAGQKPINSVTAAELQADLAAGKPVVLDSLAQPNPNQLLPFGLVGPHAYMLDSIVITPQGALVQLKNPWGNRHPKPIPFNQLSQSIGWVETGSSL